jgi:hypothetical protein
MNWIVFEVLCRRRHKDVDEVLVQWACAWITQADFLAGTHGVGVEVARRQSVLGDTEILVQWACSWIPASDCDGGLLQELIARDKMVGEHVCISGASDAVIEDASVEKTAGGDNGDQGNVVDGPGQPVVAVMPLVAAPDEKKRAPVKRRRAGNGWT